MITDGSMSDAEIKRIWDSFGPEGQNIPFAEFRKQCKELTNPKKLYDDAVELLLEQQLERSRRIAINRGLR